MKKTGIMGGTFNPIHNGHIEIAEAAFKQFGLDEVWFMPNHIPAYKPDADIVSGEQRLKMVELAIEDYPHFFASDFEIKRDGKTYTYVTLSKLRELYPDNRFYFIMGADSLFYFDKWVKPDVILKYADILVAARDNNGAEEIYNRIAFLEQHFDKACFSVINCANIDCSSSEIRTYLADISDHAHNNYADNKARVKLLEKQAYINKYLPENVYEYIKCNHLYNHR